MEPSPALNGTVFDNLRMAPLRVGAPILDVWRAITANLPASEAPLLPTSLARVLPLLTANPERLRLAVDLAVAFDLFEAAGAAVSVAQRSRDSQVALSAAALCGNPGVPQEIVDAARDFGRGLELTEPQTRALELRLSPEFSAIGELEAELKISLWPGESIVPSGERRWVAFDQLGQPSNSYWTLLGDIYERGLNIRRIPDHPSRQPSLSWIGPDVVVVTWLNDIVSRLKDSMDFDIRLLLKSPALNSERVRKQLLRKLEQLVGVAQPGPDWLVETTVTLEEPMHPSVFHRGAFDSVEMAFLGGGKRSRLDGVAGEVLNPRRIPHTRERIWTFDQLVAYRIWHFFEPETSRRSARSLLESLHKKARSVNSHVVAVTSSGSLLVRKGDDFIDSETGQSVFRDIVAIDKVFRPFELGGGHVPDLLTPSLHTTVHPSRLGGTPALLDHRISARSIASINEQRGWEAVTETYPNIPTDLLEDAAETGRALLAKR